MVEYAIPAWREGEGEGAEKPYHLPLGCRSRLKEHVLFRNLGSRAHGQWSSTWSVILPISAHHRRKDLYDCASTSMAHPTSSRAYLDGIEKRNTVQSHLGTKRDEMRRPSTRMTRCRIPHVRERHHSKTQRPIHIAQPTKACLLDGLGPRTNRDHKTLFDECVLGVRANVFTTNELKTKSYHKEQLSLSTTGGHSVRAVVNVHVVNSER